MLWAFLLFLPIEFTFMDYIQKLDALLKADIKKGIVRIEKTEIIGVNDKEYDL